MSAIPPAAPMRYHVPVSDFVHSQDLTALGGIAARLVSILARPRAMAWLCIGVLGASGWIALALIAAQSGGFAALCRPAAIGGWREFAIAAPAWAAMTLAMMLPVGGPMLLTYAEIADTAIRRGEEVASPLALVAGYVAVWLGFAIAAAGLQSALPPALGAASGETARAVTGGLMLAAGLYQLSPMKRACLTLCQRPFPFFFANWTVSPSGVFRLGLRQGLHCVGCCWALMLLMLATGAMNIAWMAALGVVMVAERLATTPRFAHAVGWALAGAGVILVGTGLR